VGKAGKYKSARRAEETRIASEHTASRAAALMRDTFKFTGREHTGDIQHLRTRAYQHDHEHLRPQLRKEELGGVFEGGRVLGRE